MKNLRKVIRSKKNFLVEKVINAFSDGSLRLKGDFIQTPVVYYKHPISGNKIVYFGMMHIGIASYYEFVSEEIKRLEREGYKILLEGVNSIKDCQYDTLNDKEKKIYQIFSLWMKTILESMKAIANFQGLSLQKESMTIEKARYINVDVDQIDLVKAFIENFPIKKIKRVLRFFMYTPEADGFPKEGEMIKLINAKFNHYVCHLKRIDEKIKVRQFLDLIGRGHILQKWHCSIIKNIDETCEEAEKIMLSWREKFKKESGLKNMPDLLEDEKVWFYRWYMNKLTKFSPVIMRLSKFFMRDLICVILNFRNDVAMQKSKQYLLDCNACYVWGSAHIDGMEKQIKKCGYVKNKVEWLSVCPIANYSLLDCFRDKGKK